MIVRNALCYLLVFCSGLSLAQNSQTADSQWSAQVASPAFEADTGPVVLVDAAHGNFHTIDGRYAAFEKVLRRDGFRVRSADAKVTPDQRLRVGPEPQQQQAVIFARQRHPRRSCD